MRMPFGKHKGLEIWELPDDYVLWLVDNGVKMWGELRGEVLAEYAGRTMGKKKPVAVSPLAPMPVLRPRSCVSWPRGTTFVWAEGSELEW